MALISTIDMMNGEKEREMRQTPDPDVVFPNKFKTPCFVKNVVRASNILIGDYTYYDDSVDPEAFEKIMSCSIGRSLETS